MAFSKFKKLVMVTNGNFFKKKIAFVSFLELSHQRMRFLKFYISQKFCFLNTFRLIILIFTVFLECKSLYSCKLYLEEQNYLIFNIAGFVRKYLWDPKMYVLYLRENLLKMDVLYLWFPKNYRHPFLKLFKLHKKIEFTVLFYKVIILDDFTLRRFYW